ncbi:MAG TPA: hypothetical protein VE954_09830 [Oligoflexus sp.]|nr:hypothetical protein [Oligoflexus sp.]
MTRHSRELGNSLGAPVFWQIVPTILADLMADPKKLDQAMSAVLSMTKPDIGKLKRAYEQG